MNPLDRLERLAQQVVEGSFQRFFRKKLHPADLSGQLAAVVDRGQNGHLIPAYYQLKIHPQDYANLVAKAGGDAVLAELYDFLTTLAEEADYQFDGPLQIVLEPHQSVSPGRVQINIENAVHRGRL